MRRSNVDEGLVRRAQGGNHSAFEAIVDASIDDLFSLASLMAHDHAIGEDAVQDALIRAWRDLPTLRDPGCIFAWLARLTINATYDQLRRHRRIRGLRPIHDEIAVADDETQRSFDRMLLSWAYGQLPPEQRAVIVLHYYLGLSLDEVASTVSIPAGTARSRLHAAVVSMRASIGGERRSAARHATAKVS